MPQIKALSQFTAVVARPPTDEPDSVVLGIIFKGLPTKIRRQYLKSLKEQKREEEPLSQRDKHKIRLICQLRDFLEGKEGVQKLLGQDNL